MLQKKYLIAIMALVFIFTSFGCKSQLQSENNENKISDIEKYVGMTIEEFSKKSSLEPDVSYAENNEEGYPETGLFEVKKSNAFIYGNLRIDDFRNAVFGDHQQYIQDIVIELPYDNSADIKPKDSVDTVKQKLGDAGIAFDVIDDETIRYSSEGLYYDIKFFEEGKADQIRFSANIESEKWKEDTFKKYCEAVPGGYYVQNGDYIVALENGLLNIYKESAGYTLNKDRAGGSIAKTLDSMIYTASDGKTFSVNLTNGDLTFMQDVSAELQTAAQGTGPSQGTSNGSTGKTSTQRVAVENYGQWDPATMNKVFGKPVAKNYDGSDGVLYDDVVINQNISHENINNTTNQQNYTITLTSGEYSIYGFYVGMTEKEVAAKVKERMGESSYGSYVVYEAPGNGSSQTITINCEGGTVYEVVMNTFISW